MTAGAALRPLPLPPTLRRPRCRSPGASPAPPYAVSFALRGGGSAPSVPQPSEPLGGRWAHALVSRPQYMVQCPPRRRRRQPWRPVSAYPMSSMLALAAKSSTESPRRSTATSWQPQPPQQAVGWVLDRQELQTTCLSGSACQQRQWWALFLVSSPPRVRRAGPWALPPSHFQGQQARHRRTCLATPRARLGASSPMPSSAATSRLRSASHRGTSTGQAELMGGIGLPQLFPTTEATMTRSGPKFALAPVAPVAARSRSGGY